MASTDSHPSARQVFQEAKKGYPGLSLATVYNTLETLVKLGLLKVMDFQATDNRHETNLHPHINLICTVCGKIQDFEKGLHLHMDTVKKSLVLKSRTIEWNTTGCALNAEPGKIKISKKKLSIVGNLLMPMVS